MLHYPNGLLFSPSLQREIKSRFHYVDADPSGRTRLFFENAGGSLRLKSATEALARIDAIPDCPERIHDVALQLQRIQSIGTEDVRTILNAQRGTVHATLTASSAMFEMVRAIAENVAGTNMVTTVLEHPSAFDAMSLYAQRCGKELRVAPANPKTGGVDVEQIVQRIDSNTALLCVMAASNISGARFDLERIVREARQVKPDLFIVVDAVQHAPHESIDLQRLPVDGINIAPYKFFGSRGSGFAWLSDRAAALPHHKLAGKPADFWDLGSAAPAQFAVITAIVDYVCWLGRQGSTSEDRRGPFVAGMEAIALHERALLHRLLEGSDAAPGLRKLPGVTVHFDHDNLAERDLILAIAIEGIDHTRAVREFERRGVITYERVDSSLYSRRMLEALGIRGAVRISPLHCHGPEDVDRFLAITSDVARTAATASVY